MLPAQIFFSAILGLLGLVLLGGGAYWISQLLRRPKVLVVRKRDGVVHEYYVSPLARLSPRDRLLLAGALLAVVLPFYGRHFVSLYWPSRAEAREPAGAERKIAGSGATLAIEETGTRGRPRVILTHGWGMDRREWDWARRELGSDFHVITWDLPGLGNSPALPMNDYTLESLAGALESVIAQTGDAPTVLVGHSIGGMINLTYSRIKNQQLAPVVGIVEVNTTYTNPVRTSSSAKTDTALQKPVYEPLLHLFVATAPLVRVLNWFSYQSGLAHIQSASQSFAGTESREQLDFSASYIYKSSPAVVSRGMLGMLHWDASDVLPAIKVPVLVIAGEQDTTTIPAASAVMTGHIPAARQVNMAPAAHLGLIEQHERYGRAIRAFAAQVTQNASPSSALTAK